MKSIWERTIFQFATLIGQVKFGQIINASTDPNKRQTGLKNECIPEHGPRADDLGQRAAQEGGGAEYLEVGAPGAESLGLKGLVRRILMDDLQES